MTTVEAKRRKLLVHGYVYSYVYSYYKIALQKTSGVIDSRFI